MLVVAPIVEMRRLTGTILSKNTSILLRIPILVLGKSILTALEIDTLLAILVPLTILLYLAVAPYTKVEESFNIQAAHDILTYGIPLKQAESKLRAQYDHLTFTGPVPRTFVGPLALAAIAWPGSSWLEGVNKQILGRPLVDSMRRRIVSLKGRATGNRITQS